MTWSFPIGRLFGSQLRVHATFFLLLLWIAIAAYLQGGAPAAFWTTLFILLLFVCVVAHEFGHALMARRFGIRTPDVTLLPIGGLARLEKMPEKPGQEIAVALAGPAVNVVIWAVLTLIFGTGNGDGAVLDTLDIAPETLPSRIAALNLILALFNLLPAFPMDGGRVLRALLSLFMSRVTATRTAASAGQVLAFGMGLLGLISGNVILILIAFFIFIAAGAESSDVAMRTMARGMLARDAMITEYEALTPSSSIELAANTLIRTTQHEFPVLDEDGGLAGFLTRTALFSAMAEGDRQRPVGEVMDREVPVALLTEGLETVLQKLQARAPAVAVTDPAGRMVGYITRENVGELMVVANRKGRG